MQLNKIKNEAKQILNKLTPYIIKGKICGSIRRQKQDCKDIDLVIIPKSDFMSVVNIKNILLKQNKVLLNGQKIIRVLKKDGLQIDTYLANEKNYEPLCLLKTGSKDHNIKLCSMAIKKNMKMGEEGLVNSYSGEIINSEKEILEEVFGKYIEPEDRN